MKNITVGYLDLLEKKFISAIEINKNFLNLLKHYVNVKIIPVAKLEQIKDTFKNLEEYKLDYLYLDSFNFLLPSFLLRERLGTNIAFILKIHTICSWAYRYAYIIPLIRKDDIIFAPSKYARASFLRISDKLGVQLIPNFLDIKYIQKNISYNFGERNNKIITFMGRLIEEKGVGVLIKCMPKIISKVNNVHLNVIGPLSGEVITDYPKSPYVKKLEREIRKLKLTNRVHFKGVRFGLEKYKILSESDVFANPTVAIEEASPMVNIEALACGLPVITTEWAGNRELVKDGENGYLIGINNSKDTRSIDAERLTSIIIRILKNRRLNLKLKRNAIKLAQKFDYHKVIPRLLKLVKKRTKVKMGNRWELIKNKKLTDFNRLFNRDFLFFLYFGRRFKNETYASLYRGIFRQVSLENKHHFNRKRIKKENTKETRIMNKLRRNLLDFLLLKCN